MNVTQKPWCKRHARRRSAFHQ